MQAFATFLGGNKVKILIAILLIVHGMIVAAQSSGSFNPTGGAANPALFKGWPTQLGQSWLLVKLGAERTLLSQVCGILWLLAGLALITAGLGVLGIIIPAAWWRSLALTGAGLSLLMLAVYLHPLYGIGVGASILVLIALSAKSMPLLSNLGL
jgi:hypothetical protein